MVVMSASMGPQRGVGFAGGDEGPDPEKAFQGLLEGFVGIR